MPTAPSWDASGAYTTVFSDDFPGSSLNTSNWSTGWFGQGISGPINGAELAVYSNTHISVSGGYLNLLLTNTSSKSGYAYTGACVTSNPNGGAGVGFQFTYGSVEWRAYIPATASGTAAANWPALWMDGQSWPTDGEFDCVEALGGSVEWHIPTDGNPGGSGPAEPYTGWHQFGVKWVNNNVSFYYDAILVGGPITRTRTSQPMYLIMNNTTGTNSQTYVPAAGVTFLVDWVYVWTPGGSGSSASGAPSTGILLTPSASSATSGQSSNDTTGVQLTPSMTGQAIRAGQTAGLLSASFP
jgi:Glycosyl hydrolases family 16